LDIASYVPPPGVRSSAVWLRGALEDLVAADRPPLPVGPRRPVGGRGPIVAGVAPLPASVARVEDITAELLGGATQLEVEAFRMATLQQVLHLEVSERTAMVLLYGDGEGWRDRVADVIPVAWGGRHRAARPAPARDAGRSSARQRVGAAPLPDAPDLADALEDALGLDLAALATQLLRAVRRATGDEADDYGVSANPSRWARNPLAGAPVRR
jgi:hypothetical protein